MGQKLRKSSRQIPFGHSTGMFTEVKIAKAIYLQRSTTRSISTSFENAGDHGWIEQHSYCWVSNRGNVQVRDFGIINILVLLIFKF